MGLTEALPPERLRIRVKGAVQGVGFRPFVHGLAVRCGVSGFVLNDADGVLTEIEGDDLVGQADPRRLRRQNCFAAE